MLERDYIMRLIRQFFEALEKLKEKRDTNDGTSIQVETNNMYTSYFHQPEAFFYEPVPISSSGICKHGFQKKNICNESNCWLNCSTLIQLSKRQKNNKECCGKKCLTCLPF